MNEQDLELVMMHVVLTFYHGDKNKTKRIDYIRRRDVSDSQHIYECYYKDNNGKMKRIFIGIPKKITNELLLKWLKDHIFKKENKPTSLFDFVYEEKECEEEMSESDWKKIDKKYDEDEIVDDWEEEE